MPLATPDQDNNIFSGDRRGVELAADFLAGRMQKLPAKAEGRPNGARFAFPGNENTWLEKLENEAEIVKLKRTGVRFRTVTTTRD